MPLAGLIIAGDDGQRAALLPVAGQSLIEHQVRIARAAGAQHIVVLVDQIPAQLVSAFDRLRSDGVNIDVARDARDAADRIHPDEQLLVLSPGIVIDQSLAEFVVSRESDCLMVAPAEPSATAFERINAQHHWAGIALLNGQILRDTVALLGDWNLGPTLLRTALQKGVGCVSLPDFGVHGMVQTEPQAQLISAHLAQQAAGPGGGLIRRSIAAPVARYLVPWLLGLGVPLNLLLILPLVCTGAALLLAAMGWLGAGLFLLVLSFVPAAAAATISVSSARDAPPLALFEQVRGPAFWLVILCAGWSQYQLGLGWGAMILALWTATGLALSKSASRSVFEPDMALLVLLVAALAGQPLIGMAVVVAGAIANDLMGRTPTN